LGRKRPVVAESAAGHKWPESGGYGRAGGPYRPNGRMALEGPDMEEILAVQAPPEQSSELKGGYAGYYQNEANWRDW